ncbi:uncharacterized protein B0I36DRAFT_323982 [Microdochium trichocladiopsis]|uniref:Uncharacterized protein n=1 Tax=Microdochium trichocladiopsis TaxID=1682393 RepID=A0A9P8Y878_9PEZI|nr:uncharacterized protein B0I36DRAFT_323982 [Microdochium trichocladiopsis]KAH7031478.1 hypothetical protein B0I36DRAFT_323982 [Microdochium trichocladiopsis]
MKPGGGRGYGSFAGRALHGSGKKTACARCSCRPAGRNVSWMVQTPEYTQPGCCQRSLQRLHMSVKNDGPILDGGGDGTGVDKYSKGDCPTTRDGASDGSRTSLPSPAPRRGLRDRGGFPRHDKATIQIHVGSFCKGGRFQGHRGVGHHLGCIDYISIHTYYT